MDSYLEDTIVLLQGVSMIFYAEKFFEKMKCLTLFCSIRYDKDVLPIKKLLHIGGNEDGSCNKRAS